MDIVKKFVNENCENVEKNIFTLIENDMDDGMELIKVNRSHILPKVSFIMLVDRDFLNIIEEIDDFFYDIKIFKDVKKKIEMMERKENFLNGDRFNVNRFLLKASIILIKDKNKNFLNYLKKCEHSTELLHYSQIIERGWLKPKFDCTKILLCDF